MKKMLMAFLVLPLAQTGAFAQAAGDAAAGKAYWDRVAPRATECKECHNFNGEGGFGPDLAGRGLSAAQVLRAVRQPWGIMPAFDENQISAKDAADIAAYFATLPKVAEPDGWNVEVPPGAPPGQATMINMGCGQCHGATFNGPRANIGLSGMNFDYFANLVYNHTTAMPQYRKEIGNPGTNLDMGNFNRARLTMGQLRQIYFWARDEIGVRAPMVGRIAKGEPGPSGVTYPVTVINNGVPGKGVIAEGLTISLAIPPDTRVVAATGAGY
jgi:cytochrome c553